jgi:predicted XRE-type DNA-binding protein
MYGSVTVERSGSKWNSSNFLWSGYSGEMRIKMKFIQLCKQWLQWRDADQNEIHPTLYGVVTVERCGSKWNSPNFVRSGYSGEMRIKMKFTQLCTEWLQWRDADQNEIHSTLYGVVTVERCGSKWNSPNSQHTVDYIIMPSLIENY